MHWRVNLRRNDRPVQKRTDGFRSRFWTCTGDARMVRDTEKTPKGQPLSDRKGDTAQEKQNLMNAIKAGDIDTVRRMIESGAPVNYRWGESPLPIAAAHGHLDIVKYLRGKGADLNSRDGDPLRYAAGNGHLKIVKWLVESGAAIQPEVAGAPITSAASNGHLDIVRYLHSQGADVNSGHGSPLTSAVFNKYFKIAEWLLDHGADIHAAQDQALEHASGYIGSYDFTKFLIERGANVNARNAAAIGSALSRGHSDIAHLLIDHWEDRESFKTQLLDSALRADMPEKSLAILKNRLGWDFRAINADALNSAVRLEKFNSAEYLLKNGYGLDDLGPDERESFAAYRETAFAKEAEKMNTRIARLRGKKQPHKKLKRDKRAPKP